MTSPSTDRYPAPSFREPITDRFVYAGWSVDPPRLPRVGRSVRRREVIARLATLATEIERDPEVVGVAVYETRLIAPVPGTPRLDVLLLARATTGAAATRLADAVRAREPDLLMRARNTRRIGDTDAPGTGTFLFNHFSATDPGTAVPAWEQAAAWFVTKMGVGNSTLLQPDDDADDSYPLVNYVQAPCEPGAFLARQERARASTPTSAACSASTAWSRSRCWHGGSARRTQPTRPRRTGSSRAGPPRRRRESAASSMMTTMPSRIAVIALDAVDPRMIADFWCSVLDWRVVEEDGESISIAAPDGSWPTIDVLAVPEGKAVKNRLHLDLRADGLPTTEELARLVDLGARRVDVGQRPDVSWVVLADPEGNEFCLLSRTVQDI